MFSAVVLGHSRLKNASESHNESHVLTKGRLEEFFGFVELFDSPTDLQVTAT